MDRDRGFNFKLLVPPRVKNGQINAVRPQEIVEESGDFLNTLQQGFKICCDKEENMLSLNTSAVAPSKPTRHDFPKMTIVSPMEKDENNGNPGELYSKLFDEVEKIKFWKIKVDSDTVQKERRLQDNIRTIETQRKAIQELQFGNESLSINLEEQIGENEDLRNKNNATRNLCNILKETFQWSADKMHLFESEREETHQVFMENSDSIKKLMSAFENLRIRVEADQQEMQRVKESLLQFQELKEQYLQENVMKDEEIAMLQTKLKDKENKLQKVLLDLDDTQKYSRQLQESTNQQFELLKSSKTEQESLIQKLQTAQQRCKETEEKEETTAAALEQSRKEYEQIILSKDLSMQELSRAKNQQAEKLEKHQTTIEELKNSIALQIERAKEVEDKLVANNTELQCRTTFLEETIEQSAKKDDLIKILEAEQDIKSKTIESFKSQIGVFEARVEELVAELSRKTEEIQIFKNEVQTACTESEELKQAYKDSEKAKEDLKEKSTLTETKVQEMEGQLSAEMKKNKEYSLQMEQLKKDIMQHEVRYEELLSNFNKLQSEKMVIQQEFENGFSSVKAMAAEGKASEEKAKVLKSKIQRLEGENMCLRDEVNNIKTRVQGKCQETETLQKKIEENCEHLQEEITEKEKHIKAVESKLCSLRRKFEIKFKTQEEHKKENKMLKKQIEKETAKSSQLEMMIDRLQEESQSLKRLKNEDQQKMLKDLESKTTFAAELENELQKLRLTAAEAIKNKEDTELKCQHKIADMVTLMEKHKSQYDRMVEEKDAELDENKKKEVEAVAHAKTLELDLLKQRTENDQLTKQMKTEAAEKENLHRELTDLKQEMSTVKINQASQARNKQSGASNYKQGRGPDISSKSRIFDFSKTRKTPSNGSADVLKTHFLNEDMKTPGGNTNRIGGTSKIKSYRIRTPPSDDKAARWGNSVIELDPKSDSSDHIDLLTFTNKPAPSGSAPKCKVNIFKKSPITLKSPGNSLKLAAMKRMRDAGWTAVTGCDKKKKKTNEKIFA
ncbi:synaptonemal complex protein 1 isoform 2-T2 [Odontesthes bonariensis]|uniref:synaptonemal complex protein 1 isoform X2 n=1 Tax=Odontesthes bonariensis TaxID=219752 RepID=UPI003F581735